MDAMRVVVANEPRSYREVMAAAVQQLRPHLEVIIVAPDDLDAEVVRLDPNVVLCSQITPTMWAKTLTWVLLYPDGKTEAEICIGGQRMAVAGLEFDRLLDVLDQTERLFPGP